MRLSLPHHTERTNKMADIYEISLRHNLSIRKLRKMEKAGILRTTESEKPELSKILYNLRKGNRLSAIHCAALIDDADLILDLGEYDYKIRQQLEELGPASSEAAPSHIVMKIDMAAKDHPEQVEELESWMKDAIPTGKEVSHHYLAVRILLGAKASMRPYIAKWLPRAFLNVRNRQSFSNWYSLRKTRFSRNATFYRRPKNNYDL